MSIPISVVRFTPNAKTSCTIVLMDSGTGMFGPHFQKASNGALALLPKRTTPSLVSRMTGHGFSEGNF
ncbi:MAG TPA: hypothetical protein VKF42_05540, partial [Chitinivibrionales bacterium]|nr:hypothetical protein [Chitinivibrionales bacterium]